MIKKANPVELNVYEGKRVSGGKGAGRRHRRDWTGKGGQRKGGQTRKADKIDPWKLRQRGEEGGE